MAHLVYWGALSRNSPKTISGYMQGVLVWKNISYLPQKQSYPIVFGFSVSPDNKNPDDARLALFSALFFGLWRVEVYYIFNSVARSSKTQKRPHAFMPCNE